MRKAFSLLSLAALTVGLLGSCSKINERLDNLEKKVDGIENEQIASINSQIDGITSSIADLGTIRSDISSLKQSAENHSIDIFNLEEADRALVDRILNLEDYLDDVLPNYAEKEWVEATFSTLEQYEATCDTIAKIDARIGALDAKLSKDIKATADSLTKWVNKQFEGYYTAAEMDASLAQMKSDIDSARAAGKISDAKADSIATELTNAKAAVDTAKANIRAEYRAAIDTAIKASEGKLTKELTDKITTVNTAITNLTTRVTNLEAKVDELTGRVDKLEGMIQSVVIVPAYSNGSVEAINGLLELNLIVSPSSAAKGLTKEKVNILLNSVTTKAASVDTVDTDKIKSFIVDDTKGTVEIKADIKEWLKALSPTQILTVAVNVTDGGLSDVTTEFVSVDNTPGYTVKFNENYGTTPATRDTSVVKGGKINKPADPTREDYFFKNWFTKKSTGEKESDWNFETMTVSQDTTLFADWVKGAKVTFRKDTVNLTVCKDTVVRPGTKVNKPAVSPDSTKHVFKGWFTRKVDGTFDSAWDFNTMNVTKDTTLYAKWSKRMTITELVATNSEFPVSISKDAIPENVWVNANNDTCYFVTGDNLYFINGKKSKEETKGFSYNLVRDDDGNYATEEIKFVMAADRDSVVKITLTSTNKPELNGDYAPKSSVPEGFVDLGVVVNSKPLYWAEKNLGATNPEDYGDYFAWGETAPYYTTTGGWPATPTWKEGKSGYNWNSYCAQSSFVEWSTPPYDATSKVLLPAYDAATKANSSWRTPTKDEFVALAANCVWIWTAGYKSTGKAGYIVYKAKNDADKGKANMNGTWKMWDVSKSEYVTDGASEATGYTTSDTHIFFPAAGESKDDSLFNVRDNGYYWSSTYYGSDAYNLFIYGGGVYPQSSSFRYYGRSIRPVSD